MGLADGCFLYRLKCTDVVPPVVTFVVAYDGSRLAKSALRRAREFGAAGGQDVRVITVVPRDGVLARGRGWQDDDAAFDDDTIERRITAEVQDIAPDTEVHCAFVEKHAPRGRITRLIRSTATELDADVLFVGSESAGRFVSALSSVGQGIAYGEYDLHVVRRPHPADD